MIGKAAEKYLGINELGWETVKEMLSGTSPSHGMVLCGINHSTRALLDAL